MAIILAADRTARDDSNVVLCDNAPIVTARTFNTEGPVVAADHYHIPPLVQNPVQKSH